MGVRIEAVRVSSVCFPLTVLADILQVGPSRLAAPNDLRRPVPIGTGRLAAISSYPIPSISRMRCAADDSEHRVSMRRPEEAGRIL